MLLKNCYSSQSQEMQQSVSTTKWFVKMQWMEGYKRHAIHAIHINKCRKEDTTLLQNCHNTQQI